MVCNERKPPYIEIDMEPFHPHTMDNTSLSICAYLPCLVNYGDPKSTGLSMQA